MLILYTFVRQYITLGKLKLLKSGQDLNIILLIVHRGSRLTDMITKL